MFINILFYWHFSGSRSSLVNMEARPLTSDMLTRRCVVTRLSDLTIERFKEAVQTLGAGAILILLPKNTSIAALEQKEVHPLTIKCSKILWKNKCILGPSYNIILNIGGKNKADEVCVNPKSHWLLFCYIVEVITWPRRDMGHTVKFQK